MAADLVASCHCGRATIRLSRRPESVTECNCSLCAKTGFRGVYFASDEVVIDGEFESYVRTDLSQAYLANHRCRTCGVFTHWTPLTDPPHARIGVNARLVDDAILDGVPIVQVDGRSWAE